MKRLILGRSRRQNIHRDRKIALDYSVGQSLAEISRSYEVSASRVRQVLAKQFRELRSYLAYSGNVPDEGIDFLVDAPTGKRFYRHPDAHRLFSEFFQAEVSADG